MTYDSVFNITREELLSLSEKTKEFHYSCLRKWLSSACDDFDKMTPLPSELRDRLKERYNRVYSSEVVEIKEDINAKKLLVKLFDGAYIECVLLTDYKNNHTACLSSEVGCRMKCEFCATGNIGFKRDLYSFEIIEQFFHLKKVCEKIDRIVYMGMGEPLCNFNAVKESILYFKNECGLSARRITVSTSGYVKGIKELADAKLGVKLAVSLVTADDESREKLMSAARLYPLDELKKTLLYYKSKDSQRIALEYCLISGINTDLSSVKKISLFADKLVYSLNVIPWNTIENLPFKTPDNKEIEAFTALLKKYNIPFTIRESKGQKTYSACGMLVAKHK